MADALLEVPTPDVLALRLVDLGCDPLVVEPIVRHAAGVSPAVLDHLAACAAVLADARGGPLTLSLEFPPGPAQGLDFVLLYAAILPQLREHHRSWGVDPVITARTVADVGRHLAVFQLRYGRFGFDRQWWIAQHFASRLFQLGRLQFERIALGDRVARIRSSGGPDLPDGAIGLSVHIARFLGPMSPQACDASIAQAQRFFADHPAAENPRVAVCHSWLLDPQLADLLPGSNIAQFQGRFTPMGSLPVDDSSAVEFTFAWPDLPLDELPRTTRLERAVVDVLRSGGHWHTGSGWFAW